MSESVLCIEAGAIFTPSERFSPGRLIVRSAQIEAVGAAADLQRPVQATRIDVPHLTLVPGFVEPHVHGCCGVDVMSATFESLNVISQGLARHGTTCFLPTTVSTPPDILGPVIERLGTVLKKTFDGARPLGIHLEGPFINPQQRGTHRAANVLPPDSGLLAAWIRQSNGMLKLITMAPELTGARAVARLAMNSEVVVAMGHSDASYAEAAAAVDDGVRYAVHTFNAMRPLTHRDSGILGAVLTDDRVFAEIIADGVHVSPEVIRIFARAKGVDRVLLVSDAISATDMPDGRYALGANGVEVRGRVCRDEDGRLAGSTLTQEVALKNFVEWSGMRLDEALRALTVNPAAALNLEGRGRLEPGAQADLTMLDNELRVMKTFVGGRMVFERHA